MQISIYILERIVNDWYYSSVRAASNTTECNPLVTTYLVTIFYRIGSHAAYDLVRLLYGVIAVGLEQCAAKH